ncbi:MAG: glycosyltransferase family 4 protein [Leptolyngbyaceae cyanobacterium MO_188.B28]|nr:glycosyltransferase family 4 protein [Leptolyngbyaceae cyanobacterium MO_188.B28]
MKIENVESQETVEHYQGRLSSELEMICTPANPRKKCAVFSHNLERNGANKFLLNLLEGLSEDLEFEIFSPISGPIEQDFRERGLPTHILKTEDGEDLKKRLKESQRFDLAIISTIMLAHVVLICEQLSIRNIWVIHEMWPRQNFGYYANGIVLMSNGVDGEEENQKNEKQIFPLSRFSPYQDIIKAFAKANRVVFPSQAQHKLYENLFTKEKAAVIYNGIPTEPIDTFKVSLSQAEARKDLGYQQDDAIILHIGTVCQRKAQKLTLSAFAKFCQDNEAAARNAKLLIVGARYLRKNEIQYLNELKADIRDKGLESKVEIVKIERTVWPYYLAADVVVCPSLNDTIPLVIGEAMACERPVIASEIGGIPEALKHGHEGLLIPRGDVSALASDIEKLLKNEQLRFQMGQWGRRRILKQFSFDQMVSKYRQVIAAVCPECCSIGCQIND